VADGDRVRPSWRAANAIALLVFLLSAAVQVNDLDPVRWILIYTAAAAACALELARRGNWWLPGAVGAIALAWSATFVPRVVGAVPFLEMFSAWEMKDTGIEESREMYGLLIVALWMLVLMTASLRQRTARGT
jgi:hypothetical protein